MTFADIVDKFLDGSYPVPMMLLIVVIAGIVIVFLSKRMLAKLNIATKDDIAQLMVEINQLREETKSDIAQLRGEMRQLREELQEEMKINMDQLRGDMSEGFQHFKENDLYHTNKAILLLAKSLIPDLNVYGRIKDTILENTPSSLRAEIHEI